MRAAGISGNMIRETARSHIQKIIAFRSKAASDISGDGRTDKSIQPVKSHPAMNSRNIEQSLKSPPDERFFIFLFSHFSFTCNPARLRRFRIQRIRECAASYFCTFFKPLISL